MSRLDEVFGHVAIHSWQRNFQSSSNSEHLSNGANIDFGMDGSFSRNADFCLATCFRVLMKQAE